MTLLYETSVAGGVKVPTIGHSTMNNAGPALCANLAGLLVRAAVLLGSIVVMFVRNVYGRREVCLP